MTPASARADSAGRSRKRERITSPGGESRRGQPTVAGGGKTGAQHQPRLVWKLSYGRGGPGAKKKNEPPRRQGRQGTAPGKRGTRKSTKGGQRRKAGEGRLTPPS